MAVPKSAVQMAVNDHGIVDEHGFHRTGEQVLMLENTFVDTFDDKFDAISSVSKFADKPGIKKDWKKKSA